MLDDEEVSKFLMSFFDEMTAWGNQTIAWFDREKGGLGNHQQAAHVALTKIYDAYVSDRERKTGRLARMSFSLGAPDYDKSFEAIREISRPTKSSYLIETTRSQPGDDYEERYRFKVVVNDGALRLDKRERFSESENRWVKEIL